MLFHFVRYISTLRLTPHFCREHLPSNLSGSQEETLLLTSGGLVQLNRKAPLISQLSQQQFDLLGNRDVQAYTYDVLTPNELKEIIMEVYLLSPFILFGNCPYTLPLLTFNILNTINRFSSFPLYYFLFF